MAKCVIADDSRIIRMLLSKIMANLNFEVIEAEDGEEVVEMVELNEPAVVIMDWRLPVLDGDDARVDQAAVDAMTDCAMEQGESHVLFFACRRRQNPRGAGRRCRRLYNETL